ncbi:HNH endonuclease signature motif containing protein [Gordonia jinhuaensis]|uniref:HNH endonuclease n=1 Tax=Gordonia jinhuaensis TaxID=1517702 RepID=A0A916TJ84_9ACTN|nr:HNH endonuclease [Gordonia jinhuaensis]
MSVTPISHAASVSDSRIDELFDETPVSDLSIVQLRHRITGHAGQIASLTARFLDLLAEFDDRGGWSGEGITSCAHWLSWQTGMAKRTAHDHVRIAYALRDLPRLRAELADGRLSYSKVRALTRVATPEREDELVNVALSATAAQVERLVRAMRRIERSAEHSEQPAPVESSGRWKWDNDGSLSVTLRLSPLDGARFLAGVVRAEYERTRTADDADVPAEALTSGGKSGSEETPQPRDLWRHVPADIAPAVIAMADTLHAAVDIPQIAPGAEVLVHRYENTDSATENTDSAMAPHLDDGPALHDTEADESDCGAAHRTVRTDERGAVLAWGRRRRQPTAAMIRALFHRDRGCAHPGCGRTRHLHVHHVTRWSDGGTTDLGNLILLCGTHHRALHRDEFGITALGDQQFRFHRRSGSIIEIAPSVAAPGHWRPDPAIASDSIVPVGGGALDLGYTTEVLYSIWRYKASAARVAAA